jgi:hypothetical protein
MADPILESSLKTTLNIIYCDIFYCKIKKVDKNQLRLKTAASLFPFSCVTFLIDLARLLNFVPANCAHSC